MLWVIGFFTVVLVIDCLLLILLVLVQLPKKEAGIGQAFGGSATDALFGAGSGNALTKMTKYATGIFFVLTLAIYIMYNHQARAGGRTFANRVQQAGSSKLPDTMPAAKAPMVTTPLTSTNISTSTTPPKTAGEAAKNLLTVPQSPPPSATTTNAPAAAK
jgi:preprotein translocase subunit SecG